MEHYLFLIPLLPLVAFVINLLLGRWVVKHASAYIAQVAMFGSWVVSVLVFFDIRGSSDKVLEQHLFTWIPSGTFNVPVTLHVDQLASIMLLVVTTVSTLVFVYSKGYMAHDGGFYRFFAYLPLFAFSMLMLVLANNLLLLYVFWEAVGLCSYLLIGFWFRRRSANEAAVKAFVVNRVGDVGFGLGIMLTFWTFGTVDFYGPDGIFAKAANHAALGVSGGTMTAIALLLFLGACGKSAQFPLHVWLPDAMEGPTPVSALIHAATMVTAGVYMVARTHPIYLQSESALVVVALIGAFTSFLAATIALVQYDLKKVIAYSTISQLGYMVFALGTGAWVAAIFHLMTHAFFKGLLFLGAGSVMHGMHDELDMRKMGGLRKFMPITFWTFLIASFANAGLIPFAGFWSKDEAIVGAWASTSSVGKLAAVVGLITAFLTALYMFRCVFMTFFKAPRFNPEAIHPHESGAWMAVPLVILAVPAALIGFIGFPPENGPFQHFLEPVFEQAPAQTTHANEQASLYTIQEPATTRTAIAAAQAATATETHETHVSTATTVTFGIISTIIAVSGIFVAYLTYITGTISATAIGARFAPLYQLFVNKWYLDEIYHNYITMPFYNFAMFLWRIVDVKIIDGTVNGVAALIGAISQRMRTVQTGLLANYALGIALGMVIIVGIYLAGFSTLFR